MAEQYILTVPSDQNALDLFKGEWSSKPPSTHAHLVAGPIPLFEDSRITWGVDALGGVLGRAVLELGPLEGGHTFMLQQLGAASITSIEAHPRAYLKCLVMKEILQINRARFLCGDFIRYFESTGDQFDMVVASGVLYHMRDPIGLLAHIAAVSEKLLLWTHYYDEAIIRANPQLSPRFQESVKACVAGFSHTLYEQRYRDERNSSAFCGGATEFSNWLSRNELIGALEHLGFRGIQIAFEDSTHPHGPCFTIAASK